jgi:hypothetical protein
MQLLNHRSWLGARAPVWRAPVNKLNKKKHTAVEEVGGEINNPE